MRHKVALIGTSNDPQQNMLSLTRANLSQNDKKLQQLHEAIFKLIIDQIKNVLTNLQAFIASDISFSAKVYFNEPFCRDVREILLVGYLKYIADIAKEYGDGSHDPVPYSILIVFSRLCLEFESLAIDYLVIIF